MYSILRRLTHEAEGGVHGRNVVGDDRAVLGQMSAEPGVAACLLDGRRDHHVAAARQVQR